MLPPPLVVVVTNISYGDGSHILIHIETEIDPRLPLDLTLTLFLLCQTPFVFVPMCSQELFAVDLS